MLSDLFSTPEYQNVKRGALKKLVLYGMLLYKIYIVY